MAPRICLVTGANRGIGIEAVRFISKEYTPDDVVYLTSRNKQKGTDALKILHDEGLKNVRYLHLDIEDMSSIKSAVEFISKEHGKLDVLVNNAATKAFTVESFSEQAAAIMRVNYFATLDVSNEFFPLLKNGRIINVASFVGRLSQVSKEHQTKLSSENLKIEELSAFVNDFIEKTKTNSHEAAGYNNSAYEMSKLALIALTNIHSREHADDNIAVVSMCPGWCKTEMGGYDAPETAAFGGDLINFLVLKDNIMELNGKFIRDKAVAGW